MTESVAGMSVDRVLESAPRAAMLREISIGAVLDALRAEPRLSRAELAARTGLSKPTVGTALRALEQAGLVREQGRTIGRRGPSAVLYEPVPEAALILGVDIGAHYVRTVVADLEGRSVDEAELTLSAPEAPNVLSAVRAIHARLATPGRSFELSVIGSPGIVDPRSGRIRSSPNIAGWEDFPAGAALTEVLGTNAVVENDVNLAALGERDRGAGRGATSFMYLSVGSGLGAGLILSGQLYRGRNGAAGEVGYLTSSTGAVDGMGAADGVDAPDGPEAADGPSETTTNRGPMERRLSHQAIAARIKALDPEAPGDPRELFDRARAGDPVGRTIVAETIEALADCIASVTAVLDLELVLIGGGIGTQPDLLLEPVRHATAARVPYVPSIEIGALGDHAVLAGAASVGAELARSSTLRRCLDATRI